MTAISGDVANGVLKCLQDTEDEIYGCDINDYPVGMDKVKLFWKSDLAIEPFYIDNLLAKCEEYEITHIIPVNEQEISVISKNRDRFLCKGIILVINDEFIIDTFLDKYKTYMYLKTLEDVTVPRTFLYNEYDGYYEPCIVKLRSSCGSKYLNVISSKEELDGLGLELEKYVIQEYIDSHDEYTVGVFSDGDNISVIIYKRKLQHGYTSFVELCHDDEIKQLAKQIANNISLRGYINIQLRKLDGKLFVFEINPRISGTVYFRYLLGFQDVLWWLDILEGKHVSPYKCVYGKVIGMRELSEKYVIKEYQ